MKSVLSVLIMTLLACNTTRIYVARHAEKGSTGADPGLTAEGKQRAEALRDYLHNDSLNGAYATQYQRTFETAEPTATGRTYKFRKIKSVITLAVKTE